MLYSLFFYNGETEEVICTTRYGLTARTAIQNFRRWLRKHHALESGNSYKIVLYEADKRSTDNIPEELFEKLEVAR